MPNQVSIYSFTSNAGNTYQIFYDKDSREITTTGLGSSSENTVTEEELGYAEGQEITRFCYQGNLHIIRASLEYPFAYPEVLENRQECGFITPAPDCDLSATLATTDESAPGTFDGTITVNASTSSPPLSYSLDGNNYQSSNIFSGLNTGTYQVFAKDGAGCLWQDSVAISLSATPPPPSTSSTPFPWQEQLCYFFRLFAYDTGYTLREPNKWDALGIVGERDKDWHGWNFQYSDKNVQLEFTCGNGKEILEAIYEQFGNDAEVNLTYGYSFQGQDHILFDGKLNFNTYKLLRGRVAISVTRQDFNDKLQSRIDTKVSMAATESVEGVPITPPAPFETTLHAKEIIKSYSSQNPSTPVVTDQETIMGADTFYIHPDTSQPSLNEIEENYGYPLQFSEIEPVAGEKYNWRLDNDGFFNISINYQITLKLVLQTIFFANYTIRHYFRINGSTTQIGTTMSGAWAGSTSYTVPINVSASFSNLNLKAGDRVYFYSVIQTTVNGQPAAFGLSMILEQTSINITATSLERAPESLASMWLLHDVVDHGLRVITDNATRLRSRLLKTLGAGQPFDGEFSLYGLTNGFNIRRFEPSKRPLNRSVKATLQGLKAIANIGMGLEKEGAAEVVRVERVDYFYQDREIIAIVPDFYEEEVAPDLIYNEVEVGYDKYKSDGFNTLDEFNTQHEYLTPIRTNKNRYSAKSDLITSGYSIEDVRRQQYSEKPTSSYEHDEDAFLIALRRNGPAAFLPEKDEAFATVQNLISPTTAYNLRLSPKRNLLNHGSWISGGLAYKGISELVKNTSVDKNGDLTTQFLPTEPRPMGDESRTLLQEKAAVTVAGLNNGNYIYRPEKVTFRCSLTPDLVILINESLRGMRDSTKNYGYILVQKPNGTWQAIWPDKLTYNFAKERCEIIGKKKYQSPAQPVGTCCPWLVVNGCYLNVNEERLIA